MCGTLTKNWKLLINSNTYSNYWPQKHIRKNTICYHKPYDWMCFQLLFLASFNDPLQFRHFVSSAQYLYKQGFRVYIVKCFGGFSPKKLKTLVLAPKIFVPFSCWISIECTMIAIEKWAVFPFHFLFFFYDAVPILHSVMVLPLLFILDSPLCSLAIFVNIIC